MRLGRLSRGRAARRDDGRWGACKRVSPSRSLGVSTRQSTDILAVEDPEIRKAAKLIREQACLGITVVDVLREVPLSRRVFESRFRKATGQTPHEAILSQRLKRVDQYCATATYRWKSSHPRRALSIRST